MTFGIAPQLMDVLELSYVRSGAPQPSGCTVFLLCVETCYIPQLGFEDFKDSLV